ncbi:MAG: hypothetical protein J7L90_03905 [Dehalococcoidia bacterium]|nr:hypothetical protein [Dehalococcoidia bacterium]
MNDEDKIIHALRNTRILRSPKQKLDTFGVTNMYYYIVTEPLYTDLSGKKREEETVVREGRVRAEKPRIVTPYYLLNLFEGFEHGMEYAKYMVETYGPNQPGLIYHYKNEPKEMNIVSDSLEVVVARIEEKVDKSGDPLSVIIKGVDEMWDVSLMKFIHEMTGSSMRGNIAELGARRLLDVDGGGIPRDARYRIESLFQQVSAGEREPRDLKVELDRWGLFHEYEDRFLMLFKKGS